MLVILKRKIDTSKLYICSSNVHIVNKHGVPKEKHEDTALNKKCIKRVQSNNCIFRFVIDILHKAGIEKLDHF